jgi:predicted amidohydrolase YtcJ
VGERAKQLKSGEWISANQGFHLLANETLDRWDLDAVAPNNPCYLRHSSGQYSVVNSKALEIVDGNRDLFQEIANMLLENLPHDLVKIKEAIAMSDSHMLEHAAHSLKGAFGKFRRQVFLRCGIPA